MRIMIHSNAPWHNTGYGKQTRIAGQILTALGHRVAYSCFTGHSGAPISWDGSPVFGSGMLDWGIDVLPGHIQTWKPDVLLLIMDLYKIRPIARQLAEAPCHIAGMAIIDARGPDGCPLPIEYLGTLVEGGMQPIAVSRFARDILKEIEVPKPVLLPHAVSDAFRPLTGDARHEMREELGVPADAFLIGICAANNDWIRKGYREQLAAFKEFANARDDAHLSIFAVETTPRGHNLRQIVNDFGLADKIHFVPAYPQTAGLINDDYVNQWYNALDVLSACSYGEGFCVPVIEANATGTPAIVTRGSALTELAPRGGPNWLVEGQPFWNDIHRGWWTAPYIGSIRRAYQDAYNDCTSDTRWREAIAFAKAYSIPEVAKAWEQWLTTIPSAPAGTSGKPIHTGTSAITAVATDAAATDTANGSGGGTPAAFKSTKESR
jgi:glycosyltransferase involved in cell wall biosynthesis